MINSIVSRDDDGLNKTIDTPLKVNAGVGEQSPVISLCPKDVMDPQWIISLKALTALGTAGAEGLHIGQGDNPSNPVVFLERNTGRVGLGTNAPTVAMEVHGVVNGEVATVVSNSSDGLSAYSAQFLRTRDGNGVLFKNSDLRTADGGPGTMTLRNDVGDLRLQAMGGKGMMVKKTTGYLGVNKDIPERQLDINGELGMNGNSIHFQSLSGHVSGLGKTGFFWHGMNNGGNPYNYGIYKVDGTWTAPTYQQLRLAWETGIELSPGTGVGAGSSKSYVDVTTGKGLMVSSGNLGVGTTAPLGRMHVALAPWDGDAALPSTWGPTQAVIGADANGGGIGMGYHATGQKSYLISAQPGVGYKDLSIKALQLILSTNGAEQMRIQADGKIGMGTNTPTAQLHVRKDVDATSGIRYTNASAGVNANAIIALQTDSSEGMLYKNSSTRTTNGGINAMTLLNAKGDLRLMAEGTLGIDIKAVSGRVGLLTASPASQLSVGGNLTVGAGRASTVAAPINGLLVEGESIFNSTAQFQGNVRVGTTALGTSGSVELLAGQASPHTGKLVFGSDNTGWRFSIAKKVGATVTDVLTAVDSGNVGIGTADPKARLDVVGGALVINSGFGNDVARPAVSTLRNAGEIAAYSGYSYGSDDGFLRLSAGGGVSASFKSYIDISGHSTIPDMNSNIVLGTGGVERLRINGLGNVGIGTALPNGRLDIGDGALVLNGGLNNASDRPAVTVARGIGEIAGYSSQGLAADDGFLRLSAGGGTNANAKSFIDLSGHSTKADMNRTIVFGVLGVEKMRLDKLGNLGIGTKSAASLLAVAGNLTIGAGKAGTTAAPTNGLLVEGETVLNSTLRIGTFASGTSGTLEVVANQASPYSGRLIFGTDNTGWKVGISKKAGTTVTDLLTIVDNGNVGIGTSDPGGSQLYLRRDQNAGTYQYIHNATSGTAAFSALCLGNDVSGGWIWKNSTLRTDDGGANTMTVRNDGGDLRLQSQGGYGISVKAANGKTVIGGGMASPLAAVTITEDGSIQGPDGNMKISRHGIQFGGANTAPRQSNSAQISVGLHEVDTLTIIGMSNDATTANRKISLWAEGGLNIKGKVTMNDKAPITFKRFYTPTDNPYINTNFSYTEYIVAVVGVSSAGNAALSGMRFMPIEPASGRTDWRITCDLVGIMDSSWDIMVMAVRRDFAEFV